MEDIINPQNAEVVVVVIVVIVVVVVVVVVVIHYFINLFILKTMTTAQRITMTTAQRTTMTTAKRTTIPIDVVCALIIEKDRLLIVRYGPNSKHPGKWEFPGGKVHAGELPENAVTREIGEELEIGVNIIEKLESVTYSYPVKTIRLIPFLCTIKAGKISLKEHDKYMWVDVRELGNWDLLPADRELAELGANFQKLIFYIASQFT